ncbi:unnamed protein product [Protopolystoma xenopodis]|uniref:Uncharacterized protein n=1 Tax=Protopolystoma xenopodis TaxID=117903 RepID=A0A3S5FEW2_9PLAT|nr:unnamed protein product [Protopolystoma xenopodis]
MFPVSRTSHLHLSPIGTPYSCLVERCLWTAQLFGDDYEIRFWRVVASRLCCRAKILENLLDTAPSADSTFHIKSSRMDLQKGCVSEVAGHMGVKSDNTKPHFPAPAGIGTPVETTEFATSQTLDASSLPISAALDAISTGQTSLPSQDSDNLFVVSRWPSWACRRQLLRLDSAWDDFLVEADLMRAERRERLVGLAQRANTSELKRMYIGWLIRLGWLTGHNEKSQDCMFMC